MIRIEKDDHGRNLTAYVDACIALSDPYGLEITCRSELFQRSLIAQLLPHAHRWETLDLGGPWHDVFSLPAASPSCPRLKKVVLADFCEDLMDITRVLDFTRGSIGQVEHLKVETCSVTRVEGDMDIPPFTSLRSLEISMGDGVCSCPSRFLRTVLLSKLTIESLVADCCPIDGPWSELDAVEPIYMPALYDLNLSITSHVFMRRIIAPALESLYLDAPTSARGLPDGDFCTSLYALVSASDAPHSLLSLRTVDIPEDFDDVAALAFTRTLERLGNLETLWVQGADDANQVMSQTTIDALTCREGFPPPVPYLNWLVMSPGYNKFPPEAAIEHVALLQNVLLSRATPRVIEGTAVSMLRCVMVPELQYDQRIYE
ncbi:hypothetical protein EV714DRAFT_219919 [Schizophyllum commune]